MLGLNPAFQQVVGRQQVSLQPPSAIDVRLRPKALLARLAATLRPTRLAAKTVGIVPFLAKLGSEVLPIFFRVTGMVAIDTMAGQLAACFQAPAAVVFSGVVPPVLWRPNLALCLYRDLSCPLRTLHLAIARVAANRCACIPVDIG